MLLVHPLYYDYPTVEEAYEAQEQYLFGDDLMVSPVLSPVTAGTGTAEKRTFIPPGLLL